MLLQQLKRVAGPAVITGGLLWINHPHNDDYHHYDDWKVSWRSSCFTAAIHYSHFFIFCYYPFDLSSGSLG